MSGKILVTGASGQLGGAVVRHLLQTEGLAPGQVVAASRDPGKLSELSAAGVELRVADFDAEASLSTAFAGVDTVLIVSTDALDAPGRRLGQHRKAVASAVAAGVGRIAYTSMLSPGPGNPVMFAPDHHGTEEAIRQSGIPFSIFRNGWYQENLLMSLPGALASGQWYTSAADGRTSYVRRDDLARAIARGLVRPPAESITYSLTGSEAPTNDEIAALASEVTGKPLQVIHLTDAQLAEGMKAAGVPEAVVPLLISFEAATRAGLLGTVTKDVEALTGRPPAPLSDWIKANRQALGA